MYCSSTFFSSHIYYNDMIGSDNTVSCILHVILYPNTCSLLYVIVMNIETFSSNLIFDN
jgi:hypothetical protein